MEAKTESLFKSGKVYKISYANRRKDARRHLLEAFSAESDEEAINYFYEKAPNLPYMYDYELYKGDWSKKLISYINLKFVR